MDKDKLIEINELLNLLSLHGGEIVCSASLDTNDINQARASGRMVVTENNIGFVWMPKFKFPTTDKEVEFFEKWFPLDVEMPDKFNDADYVQKNIIDKVSLTAPVPDGKVTDEEIKGEAEKYAGVNSVRIYYPQVFHDRSTGFMSGAKWMQTKLTKTPDAG